MAKLRYNIHHRPSGGSIHIEGESTKELHEIEQSECSKRNWKDYDCWREVIP
ncbi:MAG: hypothetical protein UY48_C0013G0037 [Candidatus Gottesmanbacteria bacterium GW2011_GWB1_49_7]|uniref:Uncharacterized protein n=1 Tax=Candidatus Gottesmanbacteria bacterium GW2011_GWB1_49_7 TaxID=1618448 RepID=A0A0G1VZ61_9BACT|nr:MAG: hypothetical protein UY48_C0013G0037 [Candidatus Gottesmanbacteria bacterium GW2011_GWB1_49_7]